jgi:transcriptional regulator with XRE-family HTH domain
MRSAAFASMPLPVRRSLRKLGHDISIGRRKRALTVMLMAERAGVAKSTYLRVEKGDPTVSIGIYAMVLFALGLGAALDGIVDPGRDDIGLLLDEERLPKRVRPRRKVVGL